MLSALCSGKARALAVLFVAVLVPGTEQGHSAYLFRE